MTAIHALANLAAGLSLALILFSAMLLLTYRRHLATAPPGIIVERARLINASAMSVLAFSVLAYRPIHTAWLLGHGAPRIAGLIGEIIAVSLACGAFIMVIASRGLVAGLSPPRVRRGILTNVSVAVAIVAVTWLAR